LVVPRSMPMILPVELDMGFDSFCRGGMAEAHAERNGRASRKLG